MTESEILAKASSQMNRLADLQKYVEVGLMLQLWIDLAPMMSGLLRSSEDRQATQKAFENILAVREVYLEEVEAKAKKTLKWRLNRLLSILS